MSVSTKTEQNNHLPWRGIKRLWLLVAIISPVAVGYFTFSSSFWRNVDATVDDIALQRDIKEYETVTRIKYKDYLKQCHRECEQQEDKNPHYILGQKVSLCDTDCRNPTDTLEFYRLTHPDLDLETKEQAEARQDAEQNEWLWQRRKDYLSALIKSSGFKRFLAYGIAPSLGFGFALAMLIQLTRWIIRGFTRR